MFNIHAITKPVMTNINSWIKIPLALWYCDLELQLPNTTEAMTARETALQTINALFLERHPGTSWFLFLFSALCLLPLVPIDHPWKTQLSVFCCACGSMVCCCSCDVMCFLSEEIYRHISLPDRHNEPPGFPKEKLPRLEAALSL